MMATSSSSSFTMGNFPGGRAGHEPGPWSLVTEALRPLGLTLLAALQNFVCFLQRDTCRGYHQVISLCHDLGGRGAVRKGQSETSPACNSREVPKTMFTHPHTNPPAQVKPTVCSNLAASVRTEKKGRHGTWSSLLALWRKKGHPGPMTRELEEEAEAGPEVLPPPWG